MIWFRKHLPNIIFFMCFSWITIKWWISESNGWSIVLLIFIYTLGFSIKSQSDK